MPWIILFTPNDILPQILALQLTIKSLSVKFNEAHSDKLLFCQILLQYFNLIQGVKEIGETLNYTDS